ncbi:hypothetical protein ACFL6X_06885, partial [Candidatus Latescibacterota bacterium]
VASMASSRALWQVHGKYILGSLTDGIVIVDQHAAHERVRFEEVMDALAAEGSASQHLLVPLTLEVDPVEMDVFREASSMFSSLGFGVREFGANSLIVDAIPPELRHWEDGEAFRQVLGELAEEMVARSEDREAMAASMACHTSIRTGERLTAEEMETLVHRLLQAREPFICPHGRPTMVRIPLDELDRLFGRT